MAVDVLNKMKVYKEYCNLIYKLGMGYRPDYEFLLEEISLIELNTEIENYAALLQYYQTHYGELTEGVLPEYVSDASDTDLLLEFWKLKIELDNKVDRSEVPEIQDPYNHPYDDSNVGETLDQLTYKELEVDYKVQPNVAEIGETIDKVTFSWDYNKDILQQSFNNINLNTNVRQYSLNNISTTTTKVLTATDGTSNINQAMQILFKHAVYYGSAPDIQLTSQYIIQNFTRNLNLGSTVTVNGKDYIYFVVPKELENITFYVGGFEGGFELINSNFKFTKNGITSNYVIFRSDVSGLGETTINIK